jgi:hypothetical protein
LKAFFEMVGVLPSREHTANKIRDVIGAEFSHDVPVVKLNSP